MNRRAKAYGCRLLSLLSVAVMLSACVNTLELAVPKSSERVGVTHEGAVANARSYFDTHFGSNTRSNDQTPTPEAPYVVGNLVPDWESGVTVANEEKCYTDFAMQKDYRYFLALKDQNEELCVLELYSRLASVDDFGLDTLNQYVATYIPDISFLSCYESYKKDNFLTCEYVDWFTGVILYTDLYGHHIAAYKYYDGQLMDSSFLYDGQKTPEENVADFMRVMGGISLFIVPADDETRAVATVDIPGGTYICCYNETTGKVIWEYYNIDTISIVNTNHIFYDPFALSGGGASTSIDSGVGTTIARPDIPSGGGGGSSTTTTEEEKLDSQEFTDKILKNTLSPTDSTRLHTMLTEILQDCMGQTLLREIYDKGIKISISFNSNQSNSMYVYSGDDLTLSSIVMCNDHTEGLVHELFHYYQHYTCKYNTFNSAKINIEIEAHLASVLYMSHITNSSAHSRYDTYLQSSLGGYLDMCSMFINPNGMYQGSNEKEQYISKFMFEEYFKDAAWDYYNTHKSYLYDTVRSIDENIKCLQAIFKNCD